MATQDEDDTGPVSDDDDGQPIPIPVAPCNEDLAEISDLDHTFLRTLPGLSGRCPICDPAVGRDEYTRVVYTVMISNEMRARAFKGGRGPR